MSNINDYLLWRGDLSFDVSPFNQIDDMILARFSYLPFNKIKMEESETIESIYKKLNAFQNEKINAIKLNWNEEIGVTIDQLANQNEDE